MEFGVWQIAAEEMTEFLVEGSFGLVDLGRGSVSLVTIPPSADVFVACSVVEAKAASLVSGEAEERKRDDSSVY